MPKKKKSTASENIPVIQSQENKYVFRLIEAYEIQGSMRAPGWYYWDEAGQLGGGPYQDEDAAIVALNYYYRHKLNDVPTHFLAVRDPRLGRVGWKIVAFFKSARLARQQYYQMEKKYAPDDVQLLVPHPNPQHAVAGDLIEAVTARPYQEELRQQFPMVTELLAQSQARQQPSPGPSTRKKR
jgi:hypothetical protein